MNSLLSRNLIALLIICFGLYNVVQAQVVSGPSTLAPGQTGSYSYGPDDGIYSSYSCSANGGGGVATGCSVSGGTVKTYSMDASWSTTGLKSVTFTFGGGGSISYSVNVTCGTLTALPAASAISFVNGCNSGQMIRSGGPIGGSWYWQTSPTGTDTSNSGTNFTVTNDGYYYIRALNGSGCWTSGYTQSPLATILKPGAPINIVGATRCGAGTVTLYASPGASADNVYWYVPGVGGALVNTGTSYTLSVSATTTFVVKSHNNAANCDSFSGNPVTATVNPLPTAPSLSASPPFLCGSGSTTLTASGAIAGEAYRWYTAATGGTLVSSANSFSQTLSATTTYYASKIVTATGCETLTRTPLTVIVDPYSPIIYSLSGGGTYVNTPSGMNVVLSNSQSAAHPQGLKKYQLKRTPIGGGTPVNWGSVLDGTNAPLTWANLVSGTYTVEATNPSGSCPVTMTGTITILWNPEATTTARVMPYGGTSSVSTGSYASYQWVKNGVDIPGATARTITIDRPGDYRVKVVELGSEPQKTSTPISIVWTLDAREAVGNPAQTGFNIESNTTVLVEGVKTIDAFYALFPHQFRQSLTYQDGLGRPYQNVQLGQSTTGNDIIQAMNYGSTFEKSYLPYEGTSRDGRSRYKAISDGGYGNSEQYLFYMTKPKMPHDAVAFAETKLSDSPLGHVREQAAPGTNWAMGSGHTVKNDLVMNAASQVRYWKPDGTTTTTYLANVLSIQQITDENGNLVRTFTDKMGRTILKQVQLDETVQSIVTPWLETYYIYDTYGNLTYQIPPKAMAVLGAGASLNANNASITELIFKYTYDARGRLIEKKVPGAIAQFYVYDKYDRLILTQDGNLRSLNKWLFAKYDSKDRPIMMGLYTNTTQVTLTLMQTFVDGQFAGIYFEDRGTILHGYTNLSFPTINSTATALEVLSVNYFDDYDFDFNGSADYPYTAQGLAGEGAQVSAYGLPTGSKRLVLGSATWLYNYVFYDTWNRPIQVRSNNHLSAAIDNLTTTVYDYVGRVMATKTYHNAGGTNQTTTLITNFYDFLGRLSRVHETVNGGVETVLASYKYNELGQLIEKNLHCTNCNTQGSNVATIPGNGGTYMQSIDYRFNIRGWMTSINNAKLDNDYNINAIEYTNDDNTDYFGIEMLFNTVESGIGNAARHNGNISAIKWKGIGEAAGNAGTRSFKYAYDKTDRLKDATFAAINPITTTWTKEVNTLNENITYDVNGNILSLQRKTPQRTVLSNFTASATAQTMDNLTYTYPAANPNKLEKVEDTGTTEGFKNVSTTIEYDYNSDGSIKRDDNKGILSTTYNELGKPSLITFADGRTILYTYDAAGMKLKMAVTVGGVTTTTDYVGGFVYKNNTLDFFSSPEGRVVRKIAQTTQSNTTGLIAYYPLDGNAIDQGPFAFNGTVLGGAATTDRNNNANKAYRLNGTNNYIEIGNKPQFNFGPSDFTVSVWIKKLSPSSGYQNTYLIGQWNTLGNPVDNAWSITAGIPPAATNNQAAFRICVGTNTYIVKSTALLATNNWYHVVGVRLGNTIKIYVNGILSGSLVVGTVSINNSISPTRISRTMTDGVNMNGDFDDIRIYNRALSDAEVAQLYSQNDLLVTAPSPVYEYEYAIKDHQGNTRIVFATKPPAPDTYTANFEDNTLSTESTTFQNYPTGAWRSGTELYDHTDATLTYTKSQLLNGANGGQVGLAKTLKVFPGDVISASVYAKYFNATSTTSNILGFATALTSAFGLTAGSTGDGLKAFTSLNNFGGVVVANNGSGSTASPKAFITILLFDQNYNFVNLAYDQIDAAFVQSGASKSPFDLLTQTVTVKEPGYAYIYISNENPTLVDVYFDDLSITQTKTPVIQYNEYYPFGLQTMNSWTRENNSNNFLYNEGTELNATTGVYDLMFRNYDPVLGRFGQVDPMASMYGSQTPYNYANNDPITYNDPLGLMANTSDWMTFGGTTARRIDNNGHSDFLDRGYGMLNLSSGSVTAYGYSARQSLTAGSHVLEGIGASTDKDTGVTTFTGFEVWEHGKDYISGGTSEFHPESYFLTSIEQNGRPSPIDIFQNDQSVLNGLVEHFRYFDSDERNFDYHLRDIIKSIQAPKNLKTSKTDLVIDYLVNYYSSINMANFQRKGQGKILGKDVQFIIQVNTTMGMSFDYDWKYSMKNGPLTLANPEIGDFRSLVFTNGLDRLIILKFKSDKVADYLQGN